MSSTTANPPNKFFLLGCWNKDQNVNNLIPRNKVIEELGKDQANYSFGIIAGDNVYPRETDGNKVYNVATVSDGFKLLGILQGDKHVILGNHNVKNPATFNAQFEHVKADPSFKWSAKQAFEASPLHQVHDLTLGDITVRFLFIDTNFGPNDQASLGQFLAANLDVNKSWNIVVGHEPLVSIKGKGEGKTKETYLRDLPSILEKFNNKNNVIYICADVHSFQGGVISSTSTNINIPMIVAGTGGASPDSLLHANLPINVNIKIDKDSYTYQIFHQQMSYGYCLFEIVSADVIKVTYKQVLDENGRSVQNNKTLTITKPNSGVGARLVMSVLSAGGGATRKNKDKQYLTYQGRRYLIRVDKNDKRRRYIKTKGGDIPVSKARDAAK